MPQKSTIQFIQLVVSYRTRSASNHSVAEGLSLVHSGSRTPRPCPSPPFVHSALPTTTTRSCRPLLLLLLLLLLPLLLSLLLPLQVPLQPLLLKLTRLAPVLNRWLLCKQAKSHECE